MSKYEKPRQRINTISEFSRAKSQKIGADGNGRQEEEEQNLVVKWLYGADFAEYNTVAVSSVPFWVMQSFRLVSFLVLLILTAIHLYNYFKYIAFMLTFWSSLLSCMSFGLLFISCGHQVVFQQQYADRRNKLAYDSYKRPDRWLWGVGFYSVSFALSLVTALVYNIAVDRWNPMKAQMRDFMHVFILHHMEYDYTDYRDIITLLCASLPFALHLIDAVMNKITIPFRHIQLVIIFVMYYFLANYILQTQNKWAMLPDMLNFKCVSDWMIIFDTNSTTHKNATLYTDNIVYPLLKVDCNNQTENGIQIQSAVERYKNTTNTSDYNPRNINGTFWGQQKCCKNNSLKNITYDDNQGGVNINFKIPTEQYDFTYNCLPHIVYISVGSLASFILIWAVSNIKSKNVKPFDGN